MTSPSFSALDPAGFASHRIADLFGSYCYLTAAVYVLVIAGFVVAIARRRGADESSGHELSKAALAARYRVIGVATALAAILLVVMLYLSVGASRALGSLATEDALKIEVTGRKWWWEFTYPAAGGPQFTTAYELHLPVGRTVEVDLTSADVIHSFWVPSLQGKRDAIPGRRSSLFLRADRVGHYEGQCAEFCGTQHANMRFLVVAEPEAEFEAWMDRSRAPARAPGDAVALRGQEVFLESRCVACHTVGGTEALATVGPNLTHLASRRHIAMGTLPNTRGHLAGWIVDPQSQKPGVAMPGTALAPDDLNALLSYLAGLR